jgi:hypothetical protein
MIMPTSSVFGFETVEIGQDRVDFIGLEHKFGHVRMPGNNTLG